MRCASISRYTSLASILRDAPTPVQPAAFRRGPMPFPVTTTNNDVPLALLEAVRSKLLLQLRVARNMLGVLPLRLRPLARAHGAVDRPPACQHANVGESRAV